MLITYVPNEFAKDLFGLKKEFYDSTEGLTALLMDTIGGENYDQYINAQDPLPMGKLSGEIFATVNRASPNKPIDESLSAPLPQVDFRSIGIVYMLPNVK